MFHEPIGDMVTLPSGSNMCYEPIGDMVTLPSGSNMFYEPEGDALCNIALKLFFKGFQVFESHFRSLLHPDDRFL